MTQSELPLYPKISSIYNKILQLAIAIMLIVVLMDILLGNYLTNEQVISVHFSESSNKYIEQAAQSTKLLMTSGKKSQINAHIEQLSTPDFVKNVFLYDETGQLMSQSGDNININELFGIGIDVGEYSENTSHLFHPFVTEIRGDKLHGYLRMTLIKEPLVATLQQSNKNTQELSRVMLIMAGCIGFFLTRGLSRFSRQGFRVNKHSAANKQKSA